MAAFFIVVAIVLFFVVAGDLVEAFTAKTIVITVTDKERVDDKYLIFTDYETFTNRDNIAMFKFNSSDYYRELEIGKTYKVKVGGYRVPFLSGYRNILTIEKEV